MDDVLLSSLHVLDECQDREMLGALRHIELVKLALMHSLEILHMKQDLVRAVSMLMQSVQTIPAPTWAVPMHLAAPKKAQSAQSG
jgi:surfactin synthase thioesterase subunit